MYYLLINVHIILKFNHDTSNEKSYTTEGGASYKPRVARHLEDEKKITQKRP